jgi:hypothetical protein
MVPSERLFCEHVIMKMACERELSSFICTRPYGLLARLRAIAL